MGSVALLFGSASSTLTDALAPDDYDFSGTRAIANLDDLPTERESVVESDGEKKGDVEVGIAAADVGAGDEVKELVASFKRVTWYSLALTVIVTILGKL